MFNFEEDILARSKIRRCRFGHMKDVVGWTLLSNSSYRLAKKGDLLATTGTADMGLGLSTDWWQSMLCSLFTSIMPPALLLIASPKRGSLGLKRTARVRWNWNNFRGMIFSMEAPKLLRRCRQTWNVSNIRFILFRFVLFLFSLKGALTNQQTCDHRRKMEQNGKKVSLTDPSTSVWAVSGTGLG